MAEAAAPPRPGDYHNAYIQLINGGEDGFFASCPTCGCNGFPNRKNRWEAEKDANRHRTQSDAAFAAYWARRL